MCAGDSACIFCIFLKHMCISDGVGSALSFATIVAATSAPHNLFPLGHVNVASRAHPLHMPCDMQFTTVHDILCGRGRLP